MRSARYFLADIAHWLRSHWLYAACVLALALIAGAAILAAVSSEDDDTAPAPAPEVVVREVEAPEEPEQLGFPEFATKNTTRVAGADAIADAAGVALAVHPSTGDVPGPNAVTLVGAGDWQAGIAAASLTAAPVRAPILLTEDGEVPALTATAIRALAPGGSEKTDGSAAFVLGEAAAPADLDAQEVDGETAAELAASVDRLRTRLAGEPEHLLVTTSEQSAIAMPAASWAARSGDPVLFVGPKGVPAATRDAIRRHPRTPVYVLGAANAIPAAVLEELDDLAPGIERIGAADPVENSIRFARYSSGSFGWNINDPGHGLVLASAVRPLDAAAAAPLSASGTWGPLLIGDDPGRLAEPLRGYLLDLKPGYETDPTRAVYNHVWVIGDERAFSVDLQAEVDDLVEVAPVRSGRG